MSESFEDMLRRIIREEVEGALARQPSSPFVPRPVIPRTPTPISTQRVCRFCGVLDCDQVHVWCGDPPWTCSGGGGVVGGSVGGST